MIFFVDSISYKQLADELSTLTDWWSFGKALGISRTQLMIIHKDGKIVKQCRRLLIETWCKLEKPSWAVVITSLFKCGMTSLGWQIAKKYSEWHNNSLVHFSGH